MTDIFDAKILCKNCNREMKKIVVSKNGLELRAVECERCHEKIIHPADLNKQERFNDLKGKTFSVKLRMVGNSHAISIPKEIFDFMNSLGNGVSERMRRHSEEMDRMVRLCMEDFGRLSMNFNEIDEAEEQETDEDGR